MYFRHTMLDPAAPDPSHPLRVTSRDLVTCDSLDHGCHAEEAPDEVFGVGATDHDDASPSQPAT